MKILIVRLSSLGDVIHTFPMVADILRSVPHAAIDWTVEEAYVDLVRLQHGVRRVIPVALRRWRRQPLARGTLAEMRTFRQTLQSEHYDFVIDTQGLIKSALVASMARLSPSGQRVGLVNGGAGCGFEPLSRKFQHRCVAVPERAHAVQRTRLVAASALHYPVFEPPRFMLEPPLSTRPAWMPEQPFAVFFHASAGAHKRWSDEGWAALAAALDQAGLPVLLPWGTGQEQQDAHALARRMANARVLPLLSMREAAALARQARIAIGVDTGLTHLAAAFGTPTIEIYCASPRWNTEGNWSGRIVNLGDAGRPPDVPEVVTAAAQLLAATAPAKPGVPGEPRREPDTAILPFGAS